MRKYFYVCDNCDKVFGDEDHLNVKGMNLFISCLVHSKKGEIQHPSYWGQVSLLVADGMMKLNVKGVPEWHFCNGKCFGAFIDKKVKERYAEVSGI